MQNLFAAAELVTRRVEMRKIDSKEACATILESVYDTDIADMWDALTNKERLPRWFAPVEGEFRLGGRYQIKGNAGGEITKCIDKKRFDLTWEYGGDTSWLSVMIRQDGDKVWLCVEHLAYTGSEHFETYGPGATGVGWDLALLGFSVYLKTGMSANDADLMNSPELKEIIPLCAKEWGQAAIAAGYDKDNAILAATNTEKFYLGG